jgi:type III secretory pathway component EscT
MAIAHFPAMLLFSFLTSIVFGVISKDAPRDRAFYALKSFGLFVGIALLIGWVTYPFPR